MSIGLCGSHRTGKSTLAKAYSVAHGVPYVPTDATGTFMRLGLDPKAPYPFSERMHIQREILKDTEKLWFSSSHGKDGFITDRTPIDMMAYALADVQRSNITIAESNMLAEYMVECYAVTNRNFSLLMVVQPGIKVEDAPGKAPVIGAYMEHLNLLSMGLVTSEMCAAEHFYIPRTMLDLGTRVEALRHSVIKSKERAVENQRVMEVIGRKMTLH